MILESHQITWVVGIVRDCMAESDGDTEVALLAAKHILSVKPLPDGITKPLPPTETVKTATHSAQKKVSKKLRKLEKQVKKLLKNQKPETKEHYGSEPPNDESGWVYGGSGRWTKTTPPT